MHPPSYPEPNQGFPSPTPGGESDAWEAGLLDLIPTPVVLLEPRTGRLLFSNDAAQALLGDGCGSCPVCFDGAGKRLTPDQLPAQRAARGEPWPKNVILSLRVAPA